MEERSSDAHVFVGREAELGALMTSLDAASAGDGRLVLLAGEGGIGKTRTVEEFVRRSGIPDDRVLWGRCPEQSGAPTYWPWGQALGSYAEMQDPGVLRDELGTAADTVAQVAPTVGERLGFGGHTGATDAEHSRFRLFDAVRGFLRRATERAVLVVLFDDLHWGDRASLALLEHVARELRRARLLLVGTYREREMRRMPEALTGLTRVGRRIPLRGLERDEVERLVAASVKVRPRDDVVAELHETCDGNPFYLEEILHGLRVAGRLDTLDLAGLHARLPDGVRVAIRRRLDPLTVPAREVLDMAAVIGRDFEIATLAAACGVAVPDVLDRLADAVGEGIVEEGAPGRFRFDHGLIRETVYADLLPAARAHAHRRVAHALEAQYAGDGDPPLAALAHHFYHAAVLGEAGNAVEYAVRAAERAMALAAYEEGVAHYERALQALALQPTDDRLRMRLRTGLGFARARLGDERGARDTFRRAVDTARAIGDVNALAWAGIGFASTMGLTGVVDEDGVRVLEDALARLPEGDGVLRAHVMAVLAHKLYFAASRDRAERLGADAEAMALRLGDRLALGNALLARHYVLWHPDGAEERRRLADEIVTIAEDAGERALALESRMWRVIDALELGDVAAVDLHLDAYERRAADGGLGRYVAHVQLVRAMRALLAGRLADAEQLGAHALALRPPDDMNNVAQFHAVQLFSIRREQGRLAELEPAVTTMVERHAALPIWRAGLALLHVDAGRPEAAQRALDVLADERFANYPRDANWIPLLAIAGEVASAVGDTERAAVLLDLLAPYADRMIVLGTGVACWGSVARVLGTLATALGRWDEAEAQLARALAVHVRANAPILVALTQIDQARLLAARGDQTRAGELLAEARDVAQTLGLTRIAARVDAVPVEAKPAARAAVAGVASLRKEGEYWTVAHGGAAVRLKDTKGLAYLATLLAHPGREFHVLDLGGGEVGDVAGSASVAAQAGLRASDLGDAGDVLDANARGAYRRRLDELRDELAEAERFNDSGRAERAREEMEFLAGELARGVGLGGRSRKAASAAERARQNVTRAILAVIRKIADGCPALGQHLQANVHTGTFCRYEPDPRLPFRWEL